MYYLCRHFIVKSSITNSRMLNWPKISMQGRIIMYAQRRWYYLLLYFTFPAVVTASDFKVFISFHADQIQGGSTYSIIHISGISLICGGTNCPPIALNDVFNRGDKSELSLMAYCMARTIPFPLCHRTLLLM